MSALTNQSYANTTDAYWLRNPVPYLEISGTPSVTLTNNNGVLEVNGVPVTGEPVSNWYTYPALNGTILLGSGTPDVLEAIGGFLYFNGEILAQAGQISNVADWYLYPALSNVNMDGNLLSNCIGISSSNGVTISGDNFVVISNYETNPLLGSSALVQASGGNGGTVNIRADKGIATGGAVVNVEALAGDIGGYGWGGTVNIKAYSAPSLGLTSKVTIEGAGVNSYAGAVPAVASLAGYNFIYGNVGVNICAGAPSIFPNVPLTTYVYGTAGVTLEAGLAGDVQVKDSVFGAGSIKPYYSALSIPSNLVITGRTLPNQYVELSMVNSVAFDNVASITGLKTLTMSNGAISNVSNIGLSNINGIAYSPTCNWSTFSAISSVNMSGCNISNVGTINGVTIEALCNWANYPAVSNVDVGSNEVWFTNRRIRQGLGYSGVGNSVELYTPTTIASTGRMASLAFSKISGGVIDYTGDTLLYALNIANPARLQTQSSYGTETVAYLSDVGVRPSYDIYVTPNGSDVVGDGSIQKPFLTIGAALTFRATLSSAVEVTIHLESGTWTENFTITTNTYLCGVVATEARQPTNIVGVITVSNPVASSFIGIANLQIDGGIEITTNGSANTTLSNCFITGVSNQALQLTAGVVTATNCRFAGDLTGLPTILTSGGSIVLRDCIVTGSTAANLISIAGTGFICRNSYVVSSSASTSAGALILFNATGTTSVDINFCKLNYSSTVTDIGGNKCCVQFANSGTVTAQISQCVLECVGAVTGGTNIQCIQKTGAGIVNLTYGEIQAVGDAYFLGNVTKLPMTQVSQGSFSCFSSTVTQTVTGANTVTPITYDTTELNTGGFTVSGASIRVSRAGNYEIIPSIQFDKNGGGVSTVEFWFQTSTDNVSWTDVARSATQCAINGTNGEVVGTVSLLLGLNANQYFRVVMASADATMAATAFPAITSPYARPAIPSIITSVKMLV